MCPRTRRQHAMVYSTATAHIAKAFLDEAAERLDIRPVQVDGGSESVAEFEAGCASRGVPLLVLPPRSPGPGLRHPHKPEALFGFQYIASAALRREARLDAQRPRPAA